MIRRHGVEIALWIALLTVPLWLTYVGGYSALGSKILIYGLAALALNLVLGFTGGLSFGHAAYFGIGAYGAGMTLKYLVASTPLAILVGTVAGGLAATLLGPLVMRRRGIYFAMITIAIGQLFYFIAVRWNEVTGGEDGLAGFRRQPIHFGNLVYDVQDESKYFYLVLLCFAIGVVIMRVLLASPLGHTWVAIRENRRRAQLRRSFMTRFVISPSSLPTGIPIQHGSPRTSRFRIRQGCLFSRTTISFACCTRRAFRWSPWGFPWQMERSRQIRVRFGGSLQSTTTCFGELRLDFGSTIRCRRTSA